MISISSIYVKAFLSYEPKTCALCSFFRAELAPFALHTRNESYNLPLIITFLLISVSFMYVETFLIYSGNKQTDRQTNTAHSALYIRYTVNASCLYFALEDA